MSSGSSTEHKSQAALPSPATHKSLPAPETSHGSGLTKWIVLLVILLAVGAAVWKIRANTAEQTTQANRLTAAGDRPTPVLAEIVQKKTMPIYLTALGTVTPYYAVTIKSRVDGQLMSVNVREGQTVGKGQLLAQIDPKPYEATVAQAQGQLTKDQANAANAQAQASRYTALYQAGVVSKESQQTQISSSGQAQGTLEADRAAIQAAKVNLGYTRISSPIDGTVGLRTVDPGNIVHASDATGLMLVTQLHPITVIFTLPEDQLPQVLKLSRNGVKLAVEAYDRSEATHLATGTVLTVDNQIDTTTGTVKVKAVFDNKDGALFPNQFVNVRLILEQRQNAVVIPAAALQTGTQGNFVYVVKEGQPPAQLAGGGGAGRQRPAGAGAPAAGGAAGAPGAAVGGPGGGAPQGPPRYVVSTPVKVDVTEGLQVIIAEGVSPGDVIVIDGQEKLKNGSRVSMGRGTGAPGGRGGANGGGAGTGKSAADSATPGGPAGASGAGAAAGQHGQGSTGAGKHGDGSGKPRGEGAGGGSPQGTGGQRP